MPHTEIIDIFELRDTLADMFEKGYVSEKVDLVLFSPPCREFSLGFHAPQAIASREGRYEEYSPDMSILKAGLEIIKMLEPRFYIIENVKGSIRHFEPYVGPPVYSIGSFWFYGNFPQFIVNEPVKKKSQGEKWSNHPLRENYRALIPLPISQAIKQAVESQTSLFNF